MSRNLASTDCYFCRGAVGRTGEAHAITEAEAGRYFGAFKGMVVADAECWCCGAQYMAWLDESAIIGTQRAAYVKATGHGPMRHGGHDLGEGQIGDLSFRAAFNDEPDPEDLPVWRVDQFGVKVGLIFDPSVMPYWRGDYDPARFPGVAESQRRWTARRDADAMPFARVEAATWRRALRAVLLWFSDSPWDERKAGEWTELTGSELATTKALCDTVRGALK